METKNPLARILYLSVPADLQKTIGNFTIDPAILIPVELPAGADSIDISSLSWEMIVSGMLKVLAWDPTHKDAAYFRSFVLMLKPGLEADLTQAAITKASSHDLELAEEIFRAVLGLNPENCRYVLNLALVLDQRAQNFHSLGREDMATMYEEQAGRWYSNAMALDDVLPETWLYAGHFHLRMTDNERALDLFKTFVKHGGEHPEIPAVEKLVRELEQNNLSDRQFKEAFDFIRMGNEEAGLDRIESFLERNPDVWNAHFMKGWALRRSGRFGEAIESFRTAVTLGGATADTLNELAICLMECEKYQESRKALEEALKLDPENVKIMSNFGILAMKSGNPMEAERFFMTVLEFDPQDPIARQYLDHLKGV